MNQFEIINNYGQVDNLDIIEKLLEYCLEKLNVNHAIFNIILIDNDEIKKLNKDYRNIDKETDVISFALEDQKNSYISDIRILGDIYVSIDKMKQQATEYNHSCLRELSFLVVHGLLHLLGYDHMKLEDEKIMFSLQEELLNGYGITRE